MGISPDKTTTTHVQQSGHVKINETKMRRVPVDAPARGTRHATNHPTCAAPPTAPASSGQEWQIVFRVY